MKNILLDISKNEKIKGGESDTWINLNKYGWYKTTPYVFFGI